jgi:hypothetical protein
MWGDNLPYEKGRLYCVTQKLGLNYDTNEGDTIISYYYNLQ